MYYLFGGVFNKNNNRNIFGYFKQKQPYRLGISPRFLKQLCTIIFLCRK